MINLLPLENQKNIKREYCRRLLTVFSSLVFFGLAAGIISFLPAYYMMEGRARNLSNQLALIKNQISEKDAKNTGFFVKDINLKMLALQDAQKKKGVDAKILEIIFKKTTDEVVLSGFRAENNKISIKGFSKTRTGLLSFVNSLKSEPSFSDVESPISNLFSDKDIEFDISVKLMNHE